MKIADKRCRAASLDLQRRKDHSEITITAQGADGNLRAQDAYGSVKRQPPWGCCVIGMLVPAVKKDTVEL